MTSIARRRGGFFPASTDEPLDSTSDDQTVTLTRLQLLTFLRSQRHATLATVSRAGHPQAAIVGIAVSDDFEIVFDTLDTTRKFANLSHTPRVAFVIGDHSPVARQSVQLEGIAAVPTGAALEATRAIYLRTFPEGRERLAWPGICHVRVRPVWLRFSDYDPDPPTILEFGAAELASME